MIERKILNHGHVILERWMGDEVDILNNAKVSFNQGQEELDDHGKGVLNFLMKNKHGSPWEAVVFRFDVKAPIFVFREWHRHRIASINEWSARYSKMEPEWYIPELDAVRGQVGKPGSYTFEPVESERAAVVRKIIHLENGRAFDTYERLLADGIAKEVARTILPVGMYSRMKWTVNFRSLMNFFSLRSHEHAQREIREYSQAMEEMVSEVMPYAMQLFNEHGRVAP